MHEHTAIHLRILGVVAPKTQVMFLQPGGRWFIWTGDSRNPRDPNNYRPMRRWHPVDWTHRIRQALFECWSLRVRIPQAIERITTSPSGSIVEADQ